MTLLTDQSGTRRTYIPILSLSASEMEALRELPEKDKDRILPLIPLKGWLGSKRLENSLNKIKECFGHRKWIADIDANFLKKCKTYPTSGQYSREVFNEINNLLDPKDGYKNWCNFLENNENLIPTVQIEDTSELRKQIERIKALGRGSVIRIPTWNLKSYDISSATDLYYESEDLLIIIDAGDIGRSSAQKAIEYIQRLEELKHSFPSAIFSVSATSFPYSFSGAHVGEIPIYERQLFSQIRNEMPHMNLVYSDRGSARADTFSGGSRVPPPRIDYPLKNDWRFIRRDYSDPNNYSTEEKHKIYSEIAKDITKSNYWMKNLKLWGTKLIELTASEDDYGIDSPRKATAARINIHLYQQLHYFDNVDDINTDEEWID